MYFKGVKKTSFSCIYFQGGIGHHFGDLFFTTVLCIIVIIGFMKDTKLTLSSEKAALLLKCLATVWSLCEEPFISLIHNLHSAFYS